MQGPGHLVKWIDKLNDARLLVIGDIMMDRFVYGEVSRISPEAPVPVFHAVRTEITLGGAGNVVRNLQTLGSQATFVSVIGNDFAGNRINNMLSELQLHYSLIIDETRPSTVKTRFIAGQQQVLRVDEETSHELNKTTQPLVLKSINDYLDTCNVVLLSDYSKGVLCLDVLQSVIRLSKRQGKPIFIDPKGTDFSRYQGANVLTPNVKELYEATRLPVDGDDDIVRAARTLINAYELGAVLVTRGANGMSVIESAGGVTHLRAEVREVYDVSGAGDSVIAVLAASVAVGASLLEAAELANVAGGIVVGKIGTAAVYPSDLTQVLNQQKCIYAKSKIVTLDIALERTELWRRQGQRIGFTNGVFDVLHHGHLSLLSQAADTCDRLIVGVHGDGSVRQLTGDDPLQNETTRSAILASLELIDAVIIFQEFEPSQLLEMLRPDVLIKGGTYKMNEVVGRDIITGYGGEVVLADIVDINATNAAIATITKGTF